jgi:hypothetical protein
VHSLSLVPQFLYRIMNQHPSVSVSLVKCQTPLLDLFTWGNFTLSGEGKRAYKCGCDWPSRLD